MGMSDSILEKLSGRRRVVLDTMLFIYLFEDDGRYADIVERIFSFMFQEKFSGLISPVTLAELMVKPVQAGNIEIAEKYRNAVLSIPNAERLPINDEVAFLAGALRGKYRLPLPDILQAASAIYYSSGKPTMISNDKALLKLAPELDVLILDKML